jgi:hypothetical protein
MYTSVRPDRHTYGKHRYMMTPVTYRDSWGHTTMCESSTDRLRPGFHALWMQSHVRSDGWQPVRRHSAPPQLQRQVNPACTSDTSESTLMSDSSFTPAAVAVDTRDPRFASRPASVYTGSLAKKLYDYPTPCVQVGRVAVIEHARGRRAESMCWPYRGVKPAVQTTIVEDKAMAKGSHPALGKKNGHQGGIRHLEVVDGRISNEGWMSERCRGVVKRRQGDGFPQLSRHKWRCSTLNGGQSALCSECLLQER